MTTDELLDHSLMNKEVFFVYCKSIGGVLKINLEKGGKPFFSLEIFDSYAAAEIFMEHIVDQRELLEPEVRSATLSEYLRDYYDADEENDEDEEE